MKRILIIWLWVFILFLSPAYLNAITLEEALQRALSVSNTIREQEEMIKKSKFSYLSTLDPYLPKLNLKGTYTRTLSPLPPVTVSAYSDASRNTYNVSGVISYRIFDGGERYAKRRGAYISYEKEVEQLKSLRQEVAYNVKKYFFEALGKKMVAETKRESYETAKRIFELTKSRYEAGIAKKSDVLQAQLRMESALIESENAQMEFKKSLEVLRSYLLAKEEEIIDVEGHLEKPDFALEKTDIIKRALSVRPEILSQEKEVKRLEMAYKEKKSTWYPKIDAEIQHVRHDTLFFPERRSDQFVLSFTFPIFDGIGRYYTLKGVEREIQAATANLKERQREVELEITNAFIDCEMSLKNVDLYEKLVNQAKANLEQSLGEYRVGKGDILSLLTSEKDLASAKERYVTSLIQANVSFSFLEKVSYLKQY